MIATFDGALRRPSAGSPIRCREREAARGFVEGLKLFVPSGGSGVVHARMHYLNRSGVRLELLEFDERERTFEPRDLSDQGNVATRLVRCPDSSRVQERFASAARRIRATVPECQGVVLSSTELAFPFARSGICSSPNGKFF